MPKVFRFRELDRASGPEGRGLCFRPGAIAVLGPAWIYSLVHAMNNFILQLFRPRRVKAMHGFGRQSGVRNDDCRDRAGSSSWLLHALRQGGLARRRAGGGSEAHPRYPLVSCTLIGRLAVAYDQQGQRLGSILLADALQRAFESANTVGSSMVIVDALDDAAAGFHAARGFVRLPDSQRLVMPMRPAGRGAE